MAPKTKITKEMVIDAAFDVIKENGHENLNARSISEYLGCSTQPVLYTFKTVDEIREAAYEEADRYHTEYIMPKDENQNPMLALGLNYVRFGNDEKNLFRFLFQTDKFGGKSIDTLMDDPNLKEILEIMAAGMKVDTEKAKEMFLAFFCVAHGLASLLANNSMKYNEDQNRTMLENVFYGMTASEKVKKNA